MHSYKDLLFTLVVIVLFTACGGGDPPAAVDAITPPIPNKTVTYSYTGNPVEIDHVSTPETDTADLQLFYTLNLGLSSKDVYFVITNPTFTNATASPAVSSIGAQLPSWVTSAALPIQTEKKKLTPFEQMQAAKEATRIQTERARKLGIGLMGTPEISLFNSNPELFLEDPQTSSMLSAAVADFAPPPAPLFDTVGVGNSLYAGFTSDGDINATCRKIASAHGKTLNIWVENASWTTTCSKANCVNQEMVDNLSNKFLQAGADNDIYEWVTNIYGEEWGATGSGSYISDDDNLTILLYDIDGDNSTNGGVIGLFNSKDNISSTFSNQRVMFYIDSVMYATPDGSTWNATDYWPEFVKSVLAHEFQHMISFYQKTVLLGASPEIWLNEMASLVTEDFVATKLGIDGPRGVSYLTGNAGSTFNTSGRLPRYCRYDYLPVSEWFEDNFGETDVLNSYSINYAFGAFLARNFGGAVFFHNLMRNSFRDYRAIESALDTGGYTSEDFDSVLQKWGTAVLLSDNATSNVPFRYRYNTGAFISSTYGTSNFTYNLGSINLFNYHFTDTGQIGPKIYTSLPPSEAMAGRYMTSNMFYKVGSSLSGIVNKNITLRQGTKLTVVIK